MFSTILTKAIDPASLPEAPKGVRLGCPVGNVRNFMAIGLNYADHIAESGMPTPEHPVFFNKEVSCVTGPFDPIPSNPNRNHPVASSWPLPLPVRLVPSLRDFR